MCSSYILETVVVGISIDICLYMACQNRHILTLVGGNVSVRIFFKSCCEPIIFFLILFFQLDVKNRTITYCTLSDPVFFQGEGALL